MATEINGETEIADSKVVLNSFQKDALNELGNIATCHAVTSLAEMTGVTIDIELPHVDIVRIGETDKVLDMEKIVAGNFIQIDGGFTGYLQVLFPEKSAFHIVDTLLCRALGETKSIESEMEQSALMETGNILASAFCSAIADFFQCSLMPSPPSFAFDMMGSMVQDAILAVAQAQDTEHVVLFRCDFHEAEKEIYGYILLFPHPASLKQLLSMLEIQVAVV